MSIDNIDNTRFKLSDLKISPKKINTKNTSIGYTILNNFDITPELIQVNNYSIDFLIQFSNMIYKGYKFIQDAFFNITSTQYTVIFIAICIIVLLSIILFSKNKPKDIFIVIYFALGFGILLAIKFVIKFIMVCLDQMMILFNHFKQLWKGRDQLTKIKSFTDFFRFIYNFGGTFFAIIITIFLLVIALMIAGAICIGIQFMFSVSKSLFTSINGMGDSIEPLDTTQTVKLTFGAAFRQSLERL